MRNTVMSVDGRRSSFTRRKNRFSQPHPTRTTHAQQPTRVIRRLPLIRPVCGDCRLWHVEDCRQPSSDCRRITSSSAGNESTSNTPQRKALCCSTAADSLMLLCLMAAQLANRMLATGPRDPQTASDPHGRAERGAALTADGRSCSATERGAAGTREAVGEAARPTV